MPLTGPRSFSPTTLARWCVCSLCAAGFALPLCSLANDFPVWGVITSVTGNTQFVIDLKDSPQSKPDREQRVIHVAGVRAAVQDVNGTHALERLILGKDVTLSACHQVPLSPQQLICTVQVDLGRAANPAVNLADMLRSWGLAQAAPLPAAASIPAPALPAAATPTPTPTPTTTAAPSATDSRSASPVPVEGPVFKPFVPPPRRSKN